MEPLSQSTQQSSSLLNRGWRIAATGFCFSLFGVGGLLMSTFWFTTLRFTVKDRAKRNQLTQGSIRRSFQFFLKTARFLRVLDYRIHNVARFNDDEGCLVVANHPSLLDYVLLASCMPRCDCIVKQSLLKNVFMRGVIKSAGYIPNADSETLLPQCQKKLDQGGMILIFPEGTRTTPGQEMHLQRGAANIALRCNVNIRVVHIYCDQPMLTKQGKWYNIPRLKPVFTVTIQDKISVKNFISDGDVSLAIAARRLTDQLSTLLIPNSERIN
jgi:1-acyl-sn-glycerol-3-phosphate acyltransferase